MNFNYGKINIGYTQVTPTSSLAWEKRPGNKANLHLEWTFLSELYTVSTLAFWRAKC